MISQGMDDIHDEKTKWERDRGSLPLNFDDHFMEYDGWNMDGLSSESDANQIGHLGSDGVIVVGQKQTMGENEVDQLSLLRQLDHWVVVSSNDLVANESKGQVLLGF